MTLSHFFEEKNVQYGKDYSVHIEDTRGHIRVWLPCVKEHTSHIEHDLLTQEAYTFYNWIWKQLQLNIEEDFKMIV